MEMDLHPRTLSERAVALLQDDAQQIAKLIQVQMQHLATRKCPLYEEVLDTQMYGFSRSIDFAVRIGLLEAYEGKQMIMHLERNLATMYEALAKNQPLP